MDEILNHGYVSPSRARSATVSRRAFLAGGGLGSHAPFALDAPEPADSGDDAKRDAAHLWSDFEGARVGTAVGRRHVCANIEEWHSERAGSASCLRT